MKQDFRTKAQENLAAAQILFDHRLFDASVNRAYYAAFHCAIVALANLGITNETYNHKWVQSSFSSHLIRKRKIYPSRTKSFLMDMLRVRNQADYSIIQISEKRAYRQLSKAKELVDTLNKG